MLIYRPYNMKTIELKGKKIIRDISLVSYDILILKYVMNIFIFYTLHILMTHDKLIYREKPIREYR